MNMLVLDIATAALPNAADYLDPPHADRRLTDPKKIEADIAAKAADRLAKAGLDLDLSRLTAIGLHNGVNATVHLCRTEAEERAALVATAVAIKDPQGALKTIVTYNGHDFDLPCLMRRARHLGVSFPRLSTDRYKSINYDLLAELTDRNPDRRRSLGFYVKRLGWTDLVKPLAGEAEARVHETGDWAGLEASVLHDLTATLRLAQWWGIWRAT